MAARAKQPPKQDPTPATPTAAPFDFATRYAVETVEIELQDPADLMAHRGLGVFFTIASPFSKEARDAVSRHPVEIKDGAVAVVEAFEDSLFEQTVVALKAWRSTDLPDHIVVDGVELACTSENVRRLFTDPRTAWAQKQAQSAYLDLGRFFGTPRPR